MRTRKTVALAAAAAAVPILLAAFPVSAADAAKAQFGEPGLATSFDRTIAVSPGSRWVNVTDGETVRFVIRNAEGTEQSFSWHFSTYPSRGHIDLRALAPADINLDHPVEVYVAPNPEFAG
ncbi:MAG TPA: CzcE family metal-binding protein [Burkholderiaceae bacterium]|nr:CzcE family metal-binding protein [Burkholderiaceae bacterium]